MGFDEFSLYLLWGILIGIAILLIKIWKDKKKEERNEGQSEEITSNSNTNDNNNNNSSNKKIGLYCLSLIITFILFSFVKQQWLNSLGLYHNYHYNRYYSFFTNFLVYIAYYVGLFCNIYTIILYVLANWLIFKVIKKKVNKSDEELVPKSSEKEKIEIKKPENNNQAIRKEYFDKKYQAAFKAIMERYRAEMRLSSEEEKIVFFIKEYSLLFPIRRKLYDAQDKSYYQIIEIMIYLYAITDFTLHSIISAEKIEKLKGCFIFALGKFDNISNPSGDILLQPNLNYWKEILDNRLLSYSHIYLYNQNSPKRTEVIREFIRNLLEDLIETGKMSMREYGAQNCPPHPIGTPSYYEISVNIQEFFLAVIPKYTESLEIALYGKQ